MKKIIGILMIVALMGCTGLNVSTTANIATDTAFVLALQNNPTYKAGTIAALEEIKLLLEGDMTYDQLLVIIATKFGGKYAVFGLILTKHLNEDKPISETYLKMLDSYKAGIVEKIDWLLLLAKTV